jgi:hypothetical protein
LSGDSKSTRVRALPWMVTGGHSKRFEPKGLPSSLKKIWN